MDSIKTKWKEVDFLPVEVIINILSRLPARKATQFRCVCKSWNFIIASRDFVKAHSVQSTTDQAFIVFNSYGDHPPNLCLYSETKQDCVDLHNGTKLESFDIVGSCCGMLCICGQYLRKPICLWNPSLDNYKILPPTSHTPRYLGFGVNSMSDHLNDFRVVSIFYNEVAMVYSLRTDSWEPITDRFPSSLQAYFNPRHYPVLVKGYLHWCTQLKKNDGGKQNNDGDKHHWQIVTFDFANAVFQTIEFPKELSNTDSKFLKAVDGCLCIFSSIDIQLSTYELWVMKEYGVVESWTRTCIINKPNSRWYPLGFTSTGSVFARGFCEHNINTLLTYNPVSKKFKCLGYHLFRRNPRQVVPIAETLIAPVPDNRA